ncbi:putative Flp pilus assembly protein, secretin CpaC [Vibrio nigripulchritudo SFn27]|uniref:Putative Flp pilus assembly protein, secretin CpaC n=1 Tax=Vibrio nigripulchritudo TaxID=28173 RepID=U4KFE8_9VIBR|nr:type II and III secretion system protein family protein [Vibrio nigripulchritudo]CCN38163.1 putative Flp pilus assembly protein, secretin CpaC [Vibrio nigripulchritudo AM115]CCN41583.1 putative Flp pilus assembly protein, secretin CpaC [Vibrio nigripulchritudo FTn2]CCN65004.1 putative Flp pilus assembly protein, secretin CpaC [Vibrio nigripulchritudo POn4]CCN77564.1 putative Flp pilus assembly protein, secretin CpaC [Vibrio nigripulchritudo SO65]CCN81189.1 putative Flp pilus assembly protei
MNTFKTLCICVLTLLCSAQVYAKVNTLEISVNENRLIAVSGEVQDVFVSDPDLLVVHAPSSRHIMIAGKKLGETDLLVLGANASTLGHYKVVISVDLSDLEQNVRHAFPDASVSFAYSGGAIIAMGEVSTPLQAHEILSMASGYAKSLQDEDTQTMGAPSSQDGSSARANGAAKPGGGMGTYPLVVNQLKTAGSTQVNISVRIVEMERTTSEQLGLRWSSVGNMRWGTWDSLQTALGVTPGNKFPTNNLPSGPDQHGLNVIIDALVENSLVNVLAEPNLTAKSGEAATFMSGGEFPFPVDNGDDGVSIEFKKFGIALELTPTVLSNNQISLTVAPEVSTLSRENSVSIAGVEVPGIETRRATTTIELADGQSFALAGLVRTYQDHKVEALPFLGEIPVLAPFFSNNSFKNAESELVIIATARLVEPTSDPSLLTTPLDRYRPASRFERVFLHKTGETHDENSRLFGNYGYNY